MDEPLPRLHAANKENVGDAVTVPSNWHCALISAGLHAVWHDLVLAGEVAADEVSRGGADGNPTVQFSRVVSKHPLPKFITDGESTERMEGSNVYGG